jgi:uncharacterized membrane protein YkvA (DUF1232 family)
MSALAWATLALVVLYAASVGVLVIAGRRVEARAVAGFVPDCALLLGRLTSDPRVPRRHRLALLAAAAYLALPIDLVPDFIPVAGQLDDAVVVAMVLRRVVGGNRALVEQHWSGPSSSLALVLRMAAA